MQTSPPELSRLDLAALIFKRMIEGGYDDPPFDLLYETLEKPFFELAYLILQHSEDPEKRKKRLFAEVRARPALGEPFLQMIQFADPAQDPAGVRVSDGWQVHTLADALSQELPPLEWLARPYLARPGVSVWFGRPKSLKSMILLDLALHIAAGVDWLQPVKGHKPGIKIQPAGVLWLDLENGDRTMRARVSAFGRALGFQPDNAIPFQWVSMPSPWPDLSQPEQAGNLMRRIDAYNGAVGLVVLDHFGQLLGDVDENSPLVAQVMGRIRTISEQCNVAIALVHHQTKGSRGGGLPEDSLRGHGSILAGVDLAVQVERDKTKRDALQIRPVAVRGPDAPNLSALWTYEQDEQLDLIQARFWQVPFESVYDKIKNAILDVLQKEKVNQTSLRAKVGELVPGVGDPTIRSTIASLEDSEVILFEDGAKGAKIYFLPGFIYGEED